MIDRTVHIAAVNDDTIEIFGYVYGYEESTQLGFSERIPRETFEDALHDIGSTTVVFDFSTQEEDVIARVVDGTLLLSCDDTGLKVEALMSNEHEKQLKNTDFALAHNDLQDEWTYDDHPLDGEVGKHRTVTKIKLLDIGVIQKGTT